MSSGRFLTSGQNCRLDVTQRTDTAGRMTSYAYDNVNRLANTTDADNKTTSFEYDALSRTTAVVDALNQHYQFAYDALGRQTGMTRGGVSMSYLYDAAGNRTQRTDYNGVVTNYAYDNLNRLTTITYPSRTATYAYDPLNNLTRATNENGSVYIGYDNRYRVSSFSDPFYYGVSYNYDTAGNRTKLKLNGATYATYTYDAVNRLTNLADSANQNFPHGYDEVNRLTSRSAPNGVTTSETYDGLDRLTALTHSTGTTTLISNQYAYNDANNITSWTNASGNHVYGYDPVDHLTSATNNAQPNESYSFDGVGNRTASHLSASYSYQPFDKLTNTANATYTYDNNGNLLSKTDASGTTNFSWNEENQLTQVTLPNGLMVNYKYDGLGRRIQRTTSAGANERYVYDGSDVLLDLNADWSVAATYLNGPGIDNHLRQTSATTGVSYYLSDHLGSTAGLTGASGNVIETDSYDSFGNSTGSGRTRYGYTGRERDPDTGLLHYRARWYDPQVGRFISEDPVGLAGGDINTYSYVSNSPVDHTDPTGLWSPAAHREIIRRAFAGCLSEAQMDQLIDASDTMDGILNGGAWLESEAYKHGMRAPYQTVAEAQELANDFMSRELGRAAWAQQEMQRRSPQFGSGVSAGLPNFGNVLHYLADSFSPAHQGFQIWHGPPIPTGVTAIDVIRARRYKQYVDRHAAQETLDVLLSDPGRLDRILQTIRGAFFGTFGEHACECND